jgi:DNA-binding FadR family transcriptional regulator
MDTEPLERKSLVDLLTDKLREEILAGRYEKGDTLPAERTLAERLRVNRTSLKHALQRLEQLGFIATRHGIGSVVLDPLESAGNQLLSHLIFRSTGIDVEVLSDLIEARTLMGAFLARLAAERRTEEDLSELRAQLEKIEGADDDAAEIQEYELAFFGAVTRATRNRVFMLVANSMFAIYGSRAQAFRAAFADAASVRRALAKLLDAIEKRDAAAAEATAGRYLKTSGRALIQAAQAAGGGGKP